MRIFWVIMAALAIAAIWLLMQSTQINAIGADVDVQLQHIPRDEAPATVPHVAETLEQTAEPATRPAQAPARAKKQQQETEETKPTANEGIDEASHTREAAPQESAPAISPEPALPEQLEAPAVEPAVEKDKQEWIDPLAGIEEALGLQQTDAVDQVEDEPAEHSGTVATESQPKPEPETREVTQAPTAPPAIVEQDDGSLLIAGRHVVRGQGTPADPYEIGMDLLIFVQETYNPRKGMNALPTWLDRFDGATVRVSGNMLFPLWAEETDELLLMKNPWDGCCIGVPPSPYDAVEVKLAQAVDLSTVDFSYGAVVGRFKVDPYIRGKWLLGLYVMHDAHLDASG